MECNKEEAVRAKALAERKMQEKDFTGARKMILKAQQLFPELDNVSQMLTVCEVHCSAGAKVNGETDWYGILQVSVTADDSLIKKQYRKLALLLHPDKNKFAGAEAAFKLIGEAHMTLVDRTKRSLHDMKRSSTIRAAAARPPYQQARRTASVRTNATPVNLNGVNQQQQHQASNFAGSQTFWTICPTCGMRYQYFRNILKKALRCQNCLKPFIAHDLNEQAVPSGANPRCAGVWRSSGVPQQKFPGQQTNTTSRQEQAQNSVNIGVQGNVGSQCADGGSKAEPGGDISDKMKFAKVKPTGTTMGGRGVRPSSVNFAKPASNTRSKRSRKLVVESSDSENTTDSEDVIIEDGPAADSADNAANRYPRRSSRQKQKVTYNEDESDDDDDDVDDDDNDDDFVNTASLKRRKGGSCHDYQSDQTTTNEDAARVTTQTYGGNSFSDAEIKKKEGAPPGEKLQNGTEQTNRYTMHGRKEEIGNKEKAPHSFSNNGTSANPKDIPDVAKFSCADPEFFNFDRYRDIDQFAVDQIWAVYDDHDCMPRYYARITKVLSLKFMLHYTWLEHDPTNEAEEAWGDADLPIACGNFRLGRSDKTEETQMFSHIISWEKNKKRNSFEVYPRKDEVWALFKGWNIGWSSDANNHRLYEYEVVEVLSDLTVSTSIIVMPLIKIKGFVSLFMQSKDAAPYVIPSGDILRFSHCIPYHRMSGTERDGIPEGALELDPAALPIDFEQAFASVIPDSSWMRGHKSDAECKGSSGGSNPYKGPTGFGGRQHNTTTHMGNNAKAPREDINKGHTQAGVNNTCVADECDDSSLPEFEYPESEFFNFTDIRSLEKFESGQIWALYSDINKFPNYYAFIKKVELEDNKVQIKWLEVCPQGEEEKRLAQEELPLACGTFRVAAGVPVTYDGTEPFSHCVQARATGRRNEFEILPRIGEIWAIYKHWRTGWKLEDFENCEYDLVEICGRTDISTIVQFLTKVDGYRAVFMPNRKVGATSASKIPKNEYPRFSHQIPSFCLTNERGGKLRGYWELDPASVPEIFLINEN